MLVGLGISGVNCQAIAHGAGGLPSRLPKTQAFFFALLLRLFLDRVKLPDQLHHFAGDRSRRLLGVNEFASDVGLMPSSA